MISGNEAPRKRGRPKIEFTPDQVENLAQLGLNIGEIAAGLGTSRDTLERRMELPEYREAVERGRGRLGAYAKKMIIDSAKKGNIKAQLFLVQNVSDWTSKRHVQVEGEMTTRHYVAEIPAPMPLEAWQATYSRDDDPNTPTVQ
jgi:hypothetical protein